MPPFNVRELLPQQLEQFFRYNGSLTTPPCYQSVLWTVFNRRAQISMGQVRGDKVNTRFNLRSLPMPWGEFPSSAPQLEKLQETLSSTEEDPSEPLVQNYRVPQPLNQRTIFASFIQGDLQGSKEMGNWGPQRHEIVGPWEGNG